MSERTNIAWCDSTWNPWWGCTKHAPGCAHCYAENAPPARKSRGGGTETWGPNGVRVRASMATRNAPLKWSNKPWVCEHCGPTDPDNHAIGMPGYCDSADDYFDVHRRRVFALSLGDWLEGDPLLWRHSETKAEATAAMLKSSVLDGSDDCGWKPVGGVPIHWLADMLDVIRRCPDLDFLLCSKRPENFRERLCAVSHKERSESPVGVTQLAAWLDDWRKGYPPHNVWCLWSISDQDTADKIIPAALKVPSVVRGLSMEPLLGPIDLTASVKATEACPRCTPPTDPGCPYCLGTGGVPVFHNGAIHWLIVGGESGPRARPCNVENIRSIVRQCAEAKVPLFVKQVGANCRGVWGQHHNCPPVIDGRWATKHPKGGDPGEWAEDIRVRQFPKGMER